MLHVIFFYIKTGNESGDSIDGSFLHKNHSGIRVHIWTSTMLLVTQCKPSTKTLKIKAIPLIPKPDLHAKSLTLHAK
jgi:hypothetical protein